MQQQLAKAVKYWEYVAPLVQYPKNESEYDKLVAQMNKLLDIVGNNENHRLNGLIDIISNLIMKYDAEHFPINAKNGLDTLKFLMDLHHLKQNDLSEVGSQGVVSEILQGKRKLNLRQIKLLAKRFHVDPQTFIDE